MAKYVGAGGIGVVLQDQGGTDYVKAQMYLECHGEEYDLSMTNSQGDHPLQHLPSLQEPQQDRGVQHHPVCLGVHHLPSRPWVHLYQEGRQDQQVQDYPRACEEGDIAVMK